jgi:hypothetical protein
MTTAEYRIVFWYDNWTPQPFVYDLTDEQEVIRVFHALLEQSDFLMSAYSYRGYLYRARTREEIYDYAYEHDWYYPSPEDDDYWVDWYPQMVWAFMTT